MSATQNVRKILYYYLDAEAWPGSGLSPANKAIAVIIVLAVGSAILETEPSLRHSMETPFVISGYVFGLVFSVEYGLRIYAAGEEVRYRGLLGRLKYAVSWVAIIDLFALLPFFVTAGLENAFLLRIVRLLRLLTLAKLGRYSKAIRNIGIAIFTRRYELIMSLLAAFSVMLLAASVLYFTEGGRSPDNFGSIPRALWWGVATITKVGYDGAFPVTVLGKVFAAIFAIAAVGVVAMPTGILAAAFNDAFRREDRESG